MSTAKKDKQRKDISSPDPKTLHTTDPQENMEGPVSSVVQTIKEKAEEGNKETKKEADKKKEEYM